jgi:hypothetical protein
MSWGVDGSRLALVSLQQMSADISIWETVTGRLVLTSNRKGLAGRNARCDSAHATSSAAHPINYSTFVLVSRIRRVSRTELGLIGVLHVSTALHWLHGRAAHPACTDTNSGIFFGTASYALPPIH